eukprot:TRINITY_DN24411_c0_g1_i3.p1 TRINITY_DN24411_c0_g1~~TRINITY_DN24411_c0_g1_i3.p1  ORF type:complete len:496 (+),score=155.92 TRINITY_DN24411_c0_g1_i3:165-1652(+)
MEEDPEQQKGEDSEPKPEETCCDAVTAKKYVSQILVLKKAYFQEQRRARELSMYAEQADEQIRDLLTENDLLSFNLRRSDRRLGEVRQRVADLEVQLGIRDPASSVSDTRGKGKRKEKEKEKEKGKKKDSSDAKEVTLDAQMGRKRSISEGPELVPSDASKTNTRKSGAPSSSKVSRWMNSIFGSSSRRSPSPSRSPVRDIGGRTSSLTPDSEARKLKALVLRFRAEVKEKEAELERLRSKLTDSEATYIADLEQLAEGKKKVVDELQLYRSRVRELDEENRKLLHERDSFEASKRRILLLEQELLEKGSTLTTVQKKLHDIQHDYDILVGKYGALSTESASVRQKLQGEVSALREERDVAQEKLRSSERKWDDERKKLVKRIELFDSFSVPDEIHRLSEENQNLKESVASLQTMSGAIEQADRKVVEYQVHWQNALGRLYVAEREIQRMRSNYDLAAGHISLQKERMETLEEENAEMKSVMIRCPHCSGHLKPK